MSADAEVEVRVRASRALSIPVALREARFLSFFEDGASRPERSRPLDFFAGAFFALPLLGREASSSARRASFSAFLRAASACLAAAASLGVCVSR